MTVRSRTPPIRTPGRSIHGVAPAPRATAVAVPGMGVPSAMAPLATPVQQGAQQTSQVPPPQDLRRLKNADLRGKIAKLERDNKILAVQLADLRTAVVEIASELDDKLAARGHDPSLLDTAFRLRRVIT